MNQTIKPTIRIHNLETGEILDREMSDAEFAASKALEELLAQEKAEAQSEAEAKAQAKASAEAKLEALGLTPDDLKALGL
jgi:hypothetical protein